MTSNSNQKFQIYNDGVSDIDSSLTEDLITLVDNTNTVTLTDDEFRRNFIQTFTEDSGTAPTGAVTVNVPSIQRGLFIVENALVSETITIQISGQSATPPTLTAGNNGLFYVNGSLNVLKLI